MKETTKYVYLDWNIFNKLEKIQTLADDEKLIYSQIEADILNKQILAPYSNAHISDLYRGYVKNPNYAPEHLVAIGRLTNNLCVVQYWGEKQVRWHYREPDEFLKATIEDRDSTASSFSELMKSGDEPVVNALCDLRNTYLRLQPVPATFKQIYTNETIFNMMFPRTKVEMNMLALCEDLYDFCNKIKTDFTLYKHYRKYLNQCKLKYQQLRKTIDANEKQVIDKPRHLTWDGIWEQIGDTNSNNTSNPSYDKIIDLFTRADLKSYRQDERFANLIDDALHSFYAAHCDYFLTLDGRCYEKAKKVFNDLRIGTQVMTPNEYITLRRKN